MKLYLILGAVLIGLLLLVWIVRKLERAFNYPDDYEDLLAHGGEPHQSYFHGE